MTSTAKNQTSLHSLREPLRLQTNLLLLLPWEIHKMIVLRAHQKRYRGLIEPATLAVPFFDAIEGGFSCKVEHEEDGDGVVADEGQHVDEFALPAQVPDGEGDFGVAD